MTRAHPNFYFESAVPPADISAAPSQVLRGAAGSQFKSALASETRADTATAPDLSDPLVAVAGKFTSSESECRSPRSDAPAAAYEPVAFVANPPAAAGNEYRFGNGPSRVSPPLQSPAHQFLKRSQISQALLDVLAMGFCILFASVTALAIVASVLILLFVRF